MPPQFNRSNVKTLGQRFGSFVSSPAVQGTAAIAPAALAIGGMLMSGGGQPQPVPVPQPSQMPLRQQVPNGALPDRNMERDETAKAASAVSKATNLNVFTSNKAVRAHAAETRKPGQTYMTPAAANAPTERIVRPTKQAHPLMLAARGAASFLGRNAGNIANGAQLVGAAASMIPPKKQPQPAQPQQPVGPKLGQLALKKAMAMIPAGGVVPPMISRPAPSNGPKRTSALDVTPGAGSSFKKATFVGGIKEKAKDFSVGAHDALQSSLNTFLTPTTSLDPHKFHAVDDTTPLR